MILFELRGTLFACRGSGDGRWAEAVLVKHQTSEGEGRGAAERDRSEAEDVNRALGYENGTDQIGDAGVRNACGCVVEVGAVTGRLSIGERGAIDWFGNERWPLRRENQGPGWLIRVPA